MTSKQERYHVFAFVSKEWANGRYTLKHIPEKLASFENERDALDFRNNLPTAPTKETQ